MALQLMLHIWYNFVKLFRYLFTNPRARHHTAIWSLQLNYT